MYKRQAGLNDILYLLLLIVLLYSFVLDLSTHFNKCTRSGNLREVTGRVAGCVWFGGGSYPVISTSESDPLSAIDTLRD